MGLSPRLYPICWNTHNVRIDREGANRDDVAQGCGRQERRNMIRFVRAYVKSMRLYYAFITGIAGWILRRRAAASPGLHE